jgi:hypothetical protein
MNGTFMQGEFTISRSEAAYEKWLGRVETSVEGRMGSEFGSALLMCDNALIAFEEGVRADDYALQILAMRGVQ